ncbi:MAG: hypothetical protein KBF78_06775 [Fuscovulum sp.]|jgi:hypothetical protein|nr:hypothetical protein [Fuscovulum sp.]
MRKLSKSIARAQNAARRFARAEDGAITVDWVVLTALVLGIQVLLLLTPAREALIGVSDNIGAKAEEYGEFLE